jgi:glycosyltransferase involved in cell wall biosynthesis
LNGVHVRSYALSGNAVDGIEGDPAPYLQDLQHGGHDVITFFAAQQWATDAALDHLAELPARKIFVPTGFSALHDPRWAAYYERMPEHLGSMDLNVFLSHHYQDVAFAKAHGLKNHCVIPNGAAEEEFSGPLAHDIRAELGLDAEQCMVLHIGSYTGIKGHREAIRLFTRAHTGNAVLVLVGNGNKRLEHFFRTHYSYFLLRLAATLKRKRIVFLELDRARTLAALRSADLFLFPSNVECSPIVLFEAMAAGVPFLSSRAGNAAEIAAWSNGGWTMPGTRDDRQREHVDIDAGARRLGELLGKKDDRKAAGEAGHKAWLERFTWQIIAQQYVAVYQDLVTRA